MSVLIGLIALAINVAKYLVIASVVLSMVGMMLRPRWIDHPLVQAVIALGAAIYTPFRTLMRKLGLPTRPIDFSPMLAIFSLELLGWLVIGIFR